MYREHLSQEEALSEVQRQRLHRGQIRVTQDPNVCIVTVGPEEVEVYVVGIVDRNRSYDLDQVAVRIKPDDNNSLEARMGQFSMNSNLPRNALRGEVLCVLQRTASLLFTGIISPAAGVNGAFAIFNPVDPRVPLAFLPNQSFPEAFAASPDDPAHRSFRYVASFGSWPHNQKQPVCAIVRSLGFADRLETHLESVLAESEASGSFSEETLSEERGMFAGGWWADGNIPAEECKKRQDLRSLRAFAIVTYPGEVPEMLVSVTDLGQGGFRIAVHAADVSFFVRANTTVDREALLRGQAIHLPSQDVPLLPPRVLQACAMTPGDDKLAFSGVMHMDGRGQVSELGPVHIHTHTHTHTHTHSHTRTRTQT
jgi:exoribonuclease R